MVKKAAANKSYSQMSEQLAEIMMWFESEEVELDQALAKYQQATELIGQMEVYLKTAANKIKKLDIK